MRGILSNTPAPSAIRLLLGSHLLLLTQAGLVLYTRFTLEPMLCALVLIIAVIGFFALIAAVAGEPRDSVPYYRRRLPHGR